MPTCRLLLHFRARLKYLPGQSVLVYPENRVKRESFVFLNAEDEKTLRSFEIRIANFFTEYLNSPQVKSEQLSAEIVKVGPYRLDFILFEDLFRVRFILFSR